ncbi:deoxynucleoside kinase [Herpetosiphon gulosus]|uniref:Deoxyadenosine/deoxycytidine kinase n=1 Tax=Herpetosiphon gulosus TaxID=1973496 RepID=A0ABP9X3H6_9CHLR
MGKLITIVGNAGIGKTTLTNLLCRDPRFFAALESHAERPFQQLFAQNLQRYALANQFDYLLLRAEQERSIRAQTGIGVQDGGLDEDFWVFTQHFQQQGYLSVAEFALCQRLYLELRAGLGQPDLIIKLDAPLDVIIQRYEQRNRPLEIAQRDDLVQLGALLDRWAATITTPLLSLDWSSSSLPTIKQQCQLIETILTKLSIITN